MYRESDQQPPVIGFSGILTDVPPLFEGAPDPISDQQPLNTVVDDTLPPHIPESGQLGIGDKGVSKSEWAKLRMVSVAGYDSEEDDVMHVKPGYSPEEDLSMRWGSIFHGAARAALRGWSMERREMRREKLHGNSPALLRGWAEVSDRVMPQLYEQLEPGEDENGVKLGAIAVSEVELFLTSERALSAIRQLGRVIVDEQVNGNGEPGPVELAVKAAPSYQEQGKRSGKYTGRLSRLPTSVPLTRKAIQRLTRDSRTHMYFEGGNVIACPTSKPDIIEFIYAEDDFEAHNASNALANVLYSRVGFNPDRLHKEEVTFTRRTRSGEVVEDAINMLDAVHWANELIAAGRITPTVIDIKTQPHLGQKWEALKLVWEDNDYDISKVLRTSNLRKGSPEYETPLEHGYKVLKEHWNEMEWDVSATAFSFLSFLRLAEREFRIQNPGYPIVGWRTLARRLQAAILAVDSDISQPGEELHHRDGDKTFEPKVKAAAEAVGVPSNVKMFLRPVEPRRLQDRLTKRGPEMRKQIIRRSIGKLAVLAA